MTYLFQKDRNDKSINNSPWNSILLYREVFLQKKLNAP